MKASSSVAKIVFTYATGGIGGLLFIPGLVSDFNRYSKVD